jgi:hypothetical protein
MLDIGFVDDLILAANTQVILEKAIVVCCEFFKERLFKLNRNKSEVLVIGPRFGKRTPT